MLNDAIYNICKYIVLFDFRQKNQYFLISKNFIKFIKEFTKFYQKIDFSFTMATQIRHWRPELECPEVLDQNFIIFDNLNALKYWNDNSYDFHNSMQGLQSNIIKCEFFTEYFCDSNFTFFSDINDFIPYQNKQSNDISDLNLKFKSSSLNFIVEPNYLQENSIENIFNNIENDILKNEKIDIYFMYIFEITNYSNNYPRCLGFSFIITPYFDKNITEMMNFLDYSIIKKNCLAKHSIAKYAYKNPELPEDWEEDIIN